MRTQYADILYGHGRETATHPRLERWLGLTFSKLPSYHTMDWVEIQDHTDDSPPWYVELKSRNISFDFCQRNYRYNGKPTALIGKNKLDYMKQHGNGIILFDFTDKLMYWVFDEDEYKLFDIEKKFVRNARADYVDKPSDVVHIPLSFLREVPE